VVLVNYAPLISAFPGVNAGSDPISLLSNAYKKLWPLFLIRGIGGYLARRLKNIQPSQSGNTETT
jgi:hypothetical protein